MKIRLLKSRLKRLEAWLSEFRGVLQIDQRWVIKIAFDPEDKEAFAHQDQNTAEYWRVDFFVCSKLMELPDDEFDVMAQRTVIHELVHLVLWQYTSFAQNVAGQRLSSELYKLEEQITQTLENVIWNLTVDARTK